jgi:hypothetical protein
VTQIFDANKATLMVWWPTLKFVSATGLRYFFFNAHNIALAKAYGIFCFLIILIFLNPCIW